MITNYLNDLVACLRPDDDLEVFSQNDSREPEEHSPENLDPDMKIFNTEIDEN